MGRLNRSQLLLESVESLMDKDVDAPAMNCTWSGEQLMLTPSNMQSLSSADSGANMEESGEGPEMGSSSQDGEVSAIIVCFACSVIISTTAFNVILLTIGLYRRLYNEVSCQLAMSQGIVDLLLAVFVMPIHLMVDLHLSDLVMSLPYFCEVWSAADVFFCTLSILHQLGMCFEKYLTMRGNNLKHFRHRFMLYSLMFIVISGSVSVPLLFDCQTAIMAIFVIASTTVSFYIPTAVIVMLVAGIRFHRFQSDHCKLCAALGRDITHRHVIFSAITLHWRHGVVKHSVSMPFGKKCNNSGANSHNTVMYSSVNPLPSLTETKSLNKPAGRKNDSSQSSSSTSFSTVEETDVVKTATLLALPTRLPCTRSELLKSRRHQRSAPVMSHQKSDINIPLVSNHFDDHCYFNPCFSPDAITSYTALQPRRSGGRVASTSSINSSSTSNNSSQFKSSETVSETQALLPSRKLKRKNNNNDKNFLQHLQQKVCDQSNHRACYERSQAKALRTTGCTFICITCWLPFFTLFVLFFVVDVQVPYDLFRASLWLGYTNGILNPLFYILGKKKMRF